MSMQDILSDFSARVNNAHRSQHREVEVKKSKFITAIAKKLTKMNFFESFEEKPNSLKIVINQKVFGRLIRISKPGRRFYTSKSEFPVIVNGFGFNLVTTSKGIMSHMECLKEGLGGEVILQAIKA